MDAWGGIIGAMKTGGKSKCFSPDGNRSSTNVIKAQALQPYVESIFQLLNIIAQDMNRSESLMRSAMGVIGYVPFTSRVIVDVANCIPSDLADAYPNGELAEAFRQDWVNAMIKETKTNREFQPRTIETARWAREQVKRQIGGTSSVMHQT